MDTTTIDKIVALVDQAKRVNDDQESATAQETCAIAAWTALRARSEQAKDAVVGFDIQAVWRRNAAVGAILRDPNMLARSFDVTTLWSETMLIPDAGDLRDQLHEQLEFDQETAQRMIAAQDAILLTPAAAGLKRACLDARRDIEARRRRELEAIAREIRVLLLPELCWHCDHEYHPAGPCQAQTLGGGCQCQEVGAEEPV